MFSSPTYSGYQLLLAMLLSFAGLLIDQHGQWLSPVRYAIGYITSPAHLVAHVPEDVSDWLGDSLTSHATLLSDNKELRQKNLVLNQKAQQLAVIKAENSRLRELLNSSSKVTSSVSVAEVIGISPNRDRQELVINRGAKSGVVIGQVALDSHGIMGQVSWVSTMTSHVLLITDVGHAMSVRVNRNGLQGILAGSGKGGFLRLLYVPMSSDVEVGDLLVSTGLEGRFPRGYPVAEVVQVERDSSSPFLIVLARPKAHVYRASHVLLVKEKVDFTSSDSKVQVTPATEESDDD